MPPLQLNVTQKFIAYLVLLSIVPLLILGFFSYWVARNTILEEAKQYTLEIVETQQEHLDLELTQVETLLANISGVEEIRVALSNETESTDTFTDLATNARIGYILNSYTNLDGLVSIDIFTVSGNHYHVGDTLDVSNIRTEVRDELFDLALNNDRRVLWAGVQDNVNANSTEEKVITAARVLSQFNEETIQQEPVALILVNLSIDNIYDHLQEIYTDEGAFFLIIDASNRVIYHPDRSLIGSQISTTFTQQLSAQKGTLITNIDDQDMVVSYTHSPMNDWTVMSLVPLSTLTAKASPIRGTTLTLLLICFGIVAFFALTYNRRIVAPIRQIIERFKQLEQGTLNWDDHLTVQGDAEVGELINWFNAFLDNMRARRQSEQALRESQERYALAVKGANDGLWDWNLKTNQIYLSTRWKTTLGYSENDIGQSPEEWFDRIHADDYQEVHEAINRHLDGQSSHFKSEHRLLHKDGSYRWVSARGLAVTDDKGAAYRMAGSHTDITERKQAEKQIKMALHEKEILLKEIHHRVKNNLQIISSLLNLQSNYIKDEQDLVIFRDSQDRVRSMALIHEKLYETENLARINFEEYIRSLTTHLFSSYVGHAQSIELHTHIDDISLGIDTAVPCGLIVNELISNALKHAFPNEETGEIKIAFCRQDAHLFRLAISNNGVPFPEDIDIYETDSLGLQLVNALVSQLDGRLELERKPLTQFCISFPARTEEREEQPERTY